MEKMLPIIPVQEGWGWGGESEGGCHGEGQRQEDSGSYMTSFLAKTANSRTSDRPCLKKLVTKEIEENIQCLLISIQV